MPLPSGLGDPHTLMQFLYCWRQDDNVCNGCAGKACRQCIWPLEQPALPVHASESTGSGSSQLVGGVPPVPEAQEGVVETGRCLELMQIGRVDDRPKLDLLQEEEEEEVGHHLPLQSTLGRSRFR